METPRPRTVDFCRALKLRDRNKANYRTILGFNSLLIVLGAAGVLQPTVTALLHNTSTIAISLHNMTNLLNDKQVVNAELPAPSPA